MPPEEPAEACQHQQLDGDLFVPAAREGETRAVTLNVWCTSCGEAFGFLGVGAGGGCPHEPTVDEHGQYLRLPIAPLSRAVLLGLSCPERVGS